eukprot:Nk52_evm36s78 gene=Nk52_evmTU36s78
MGYLAFIFLSLAFATGNVAALEECKYSSIWTIDEDVNYVKFCSGDKRCCPWPSDYCCDEDINNLAEIGFWVVVAVAVLTFCAVIVPIMCMCCCCTCCCNGKKSKVELVHSYETTHYGTVPNSHGNIYDFNGSVPGPDSRNGRFEYQQRPLHTQEYVPIRGYAQGRGVGRGNPNPQVSGPMNTSGIGRPHMVIPHPYYPVHQQNVTAGNSTQQGNESEQRGYFNPYYMNNGVRGNGYIYYDESDGSNSSAPPLELHRPEQPETKPPAYSEK